MYKHNNGGDDPIAGHDTKEAIMAPMTENYNKLNASQSTVWAKIRSLFAKAMEEYVASNAATTSSNNFRVADFGCATGGNSIAPLQFISNQLPAECGMEIYLGDLPRNAWNTVATTVTPESIVKDSATNRSSKDTFVYMLGRTFYDKCVPPDTLDLSYSLVAVHWMKSYPGGIPTGLYATDPIHNTDPQLLQAWRIAGQVDFLDFVDARYRELRMNGHFVGAIACSKSNGDYPWSQVGRILYDILLTKVESSDDLTSCVLPCCWRTESDVRLGFDDGRWRIESLEFYETKDPIRESLERNEVTLFEYGKAVIDSFKAVCHQTCISSLAKTLIQKKAEQILEDSYIECIDIIATDPEKYNLDVSFWYVMTKKVN